MTTNNTQSLSQKAICRVVTSELPLSCPKSTGEKWDNHPRIYLPISNTGYASCPYCSTVYYLDKDDKLSASTQDGTTVL